MPPVLAVLGSSRSGKTTLIEYLINELSKESFKIGTIKHIHTDTQTFETPGKDTWRHSKAGAELVLGVASREIALFNREKLDFRSIEDLVSFMRRRSLNLIIVEGFKDLVGARRDVSKIITAKDDEDLKSTLCGVSEPIIAVTGPIAGKASHEASLKLPIIDIYKDGECLLRVIRALMKK